MFFLIEISFYHNAFYDFRIASANVLEGFSGLFESTEFQSYLSEFEYNNENYDNTFHNAQDDLGSYSISDSSNISSISSLGLDSDLSTDLTLDSETDLNFDLESIKGRSLDSQVEPTTSSFEVGCYNGSNGEGWIAFVLFNFLAMFIIPLLVSFLCYKSKLLFLINTLKRLIFFLCEQVKPI